MRVSPQFSGQFNNIQLRRDSVTQKSDLMPFTDLKYKCAHLARKYPNSMIKLSYSDVTGAVFSQGQQMGAELAKMHTGALQRIGKVEIVNMGGATTALSIGRLEAELNKFLATKKYGVRQADSREFLDGVPYNRQVIYSNDSNRAIINP